MAPQTAMTVLGPVDVRDLGVTLPHEHALLDLTCLWHPPLHPWQEPLVEQALGPLSREHLCRDPYVSRPNLRLDDPEVAVEELSRYRDASGQTLVDLTVQGISPRPAALRAIALQTGLHIVMGCGIYVRSAHPPMVATTSEERLAEMLISEIQDGFGDTAIRPGIIGELGTSSPIHPDEEKVLRAAARAQRATGLAINVHVAIFGREALNVLQVLEATGADPSRVVVSHLDELLDLNYHREVLERGAYVEYDTFGSEFYFEHRGQGEPTDGERIEALLRLLDEGWTERLLLSQDVCTKLQLRRYGGRGYAHLLETIVPELRRRGVDDGTIGVMLVDNPVRVLAGS